MSSYILLSMKNESSPRCPTNIVLLRIICELKYDISLMHRQMVFLRKKTFSAFELCFIVLQANKKGFEPYYEVLEPPARDTSWDGH